MSFALNRSALIVIGRRNIIPPTLRSLFSTDEPKDPKEDLAKLLMKMKVAQSAPKNTNHLKAKPTKKVIPPEDPDSSSSSSDSDSSSSDDEHLEAQAVRATDRVAAQRANEANLNEDDTLALKSSINDKLTRKLKSIQKETKAARKSSQVSGGMEQLLSTMKIQKKLEEPQRSNIVREVELTPEQKRFLAERRLLRQNQRLQKEAQEHEPIDLLNAEQPLKIFSHEKSTSVDDQIVLNSWNTASSRELKILRAQPPRNLIEDMVAMTEKGILWHFPIDNEQGITEVFIRL